MLLFQMNMYVTKNGVRIKTALFIIIFFVVGQATGQIRSDKNFYFEQTNPERTVEGVVLSNDSSSGVPYRVFLETKLNYISNQSGTSVINITSATPMNSYRSGLELYIKMTTVNSDHLFINLNNLGEVEIKKNDTTSLFVNEIAANQIIKVMYNGTYFILQSLSSVKCPAGFVNVNDNYCIETDEREAVAYLTAVDLCYSKNARLCTWGEWYYACQKTSLSLLNMTNNFEYVDDASDHTNTILITGNGACTSFSTFTVSSTGTYKYRCCYNK